MKSQCAMAERCIRGCCPYMKARVTGSRTESQAPGPFCVELEGGSSKEEHLVPGLTFPDRSQTQKFKEEQQSSSASGRTSTRRRVRMLRSTRGVARGRKPIQPREGCKHQDGTTYLQSVGQSQDLANRAQ